MFAIIGGSSLDRLSALADVRRVEMAAPSTPYGAPSGPLIFGKLAGHDIIFLARHGENHSVPPHKINYRANLWALQAQGVTQIVAVVTVGGIGAYFTAGTLAVPDQIIDYTHSARSTAC